MSSQRPGGRSISGRLRLTHATEQGTAAGIHGVIVSAAVMASSHADSAVALIVAVLVSLSVYWGVERYSGLVAERVHAGHRPTRRQLRQHLTAGWELVVVSALPLAVLALLRLFHADLRDAVLAALSCSTLLLCLAGWETGRHGQLTAVERLLSTAVAGLFGVALIVLKTVLH